MNTDIDLWVGVVAIGFIIAVTVIACVYNDREHERLMQQCMADGKKEYECVSMLKSNDSTLIITTPVMGR